MTGRRADSTGPESTMPATAILSGSKSGGAASSEGRAVERVTRTFSQSPRCAAQRQRDPRAERRHPRRHRAGDTAATSLPHRPGSPAEPWPPPGETWPLRSPRHARPGSCLLRARRTSIWRTQPCPKRSATARGARFRFLTFAPVSITNLLSARIASLSRRPFSVRPVSAVPVKPPSF